MIFTSYSYAIFLLGVFVLHWASPIAWRKWLLIFASFLFYATWRWQHLPLLLAVALFNWAYARFGLERAENPLPLWPGVVFNVGVLAVFKYADFVLGNISAVTRVLGSHWHPQPTGIILPLGVSFFTFQGIAYLVDVASGDPPIARLKTFLLYKAFWPQLIAGPIIRPSEIREQLERDSVLSYDDFAFGMRRVIQGAFKKAVIADTLAQHVDLAFLGQGQPHALDTLAGIAGFGMQIYFDFSGYSDIAIGSARLFGYHFPENFEWPYGARSPQEFWNRWHITLSRWIRDYVFLPMSFASRDRPRLRFVWLVLAMGLCGLWHGARWTFVCWGLWHGVALAIQASLPQTNPPQTSVVRDRLSQVWTMFIVFGGWLLFRAPSLASVADHVVALATFRGGFRPALIRENGILSIGIITGLTLAFSFSHRAIEAALKPRFDSVAWRTWFVPTLYAVLLASVIVLDQEAKAFVYFQF